MRCKSTRATSADEREPSQEELIVQQPIEHEQRLALALGDLRGNLDVSLGTTAKSYDIPESTLQRRREITASADESEPSQEKVIILVRQPIEREHEQFTLGTTAKSTQQSVPREKRLGQALDYLKKRLNALLRAAVKSYNIPRRTLQDGLAGTRNKSVAH